MARATSKSPLERQTLLNLKRLARNVEGTQDARVVRSEPFKERLGYLLDYIAEL